MSKVFTRFVEYLRARGASHDFTRWVGRRGIHKTWHDCTRADWMLWLIGRMEEEPGWPFRQNIVEAACACAETALRYIPDDDQRPRKAIEMARAWAIGEATPKQIEIATFNALAAEEQYSRGRGSLRLTYAAQRAAHAAFTAAHAAYTSGPSWPMAAATEAAQAFVADSHSLPAPLTNPSTSLRRSMLDKQDKYLALMADRVRLVIPVSTMPRRMMEKAP